MCQILADVFNNKLLIVMQCWQQTHNSLFRIIVRERERFGCVDCNMCGNGGFGLEHCKCCKNGELNHLFVVNFTTK